MNHQDHVNLLRPANLQPGGIWADFGAGSGAFTLALRELVGSQAEIYAIDKDKRRLDELKQAYQMRFGNITDGRKSLHPITADYTQELDLPLLDGIVMANSLHFFKDKDRILLHVCSFLKPDGIFLLVEYNVDTGNLWVPYPLSFKTFCILAARLGFATPRLLARRSSHFLNEIYSTMAIKIL